MSSTRPEMTDPEDANEFAAAFSGIFSNTTELSALAASRTARAAGENFYSPSGEQIFIESGSVVETQTIGTGTDFNPSNVWVAYKFTTSTDVSFIQAAKFRLKKTVGLTDNSRISIALYSDVAGVPTVNLSSGGEIRAGQIASFGVFQEIGTILQNVTTALLPSTAYWVVITRSETGGEFVFDAAAGSGVTYEGASLGALADSGVSIFCKIMARSQYGIHLYVPNSHAVWGVSETGVAGRFDSTFHYGVFATSVTDPAIRGVSTYDAGVQGNSANGNGGYFVSAGVAGYGVHGLNNAVSGGYPGIYGESVSGPGVIAQTSVTGARAVAFRAFQGIQFIGVGVETTSAGQPTGYQTTKGDIYWDSNPAVAGGAAFYRTVVTGTPGIFGIVHLDGISADKGDANVTLTWGSVESTVIFSTSLTANRTITLAGGIRGAKMRITRSATGAFNLDVGGVKTLTAGQWCDIQHNGTTWVCTAAGTL